MAGENKDIETLLKNIQQGLKHYSIAELNKAIVAVLNKKHDKREEVDFVLDIVATHFSTSVRALKISKERGKMIDAKQLCYCLLHFELGLTIRYIANTVFDKWPNSVATGITRFRKANPNIKTDKEFLDVYSQLQQKLMNYITNEKK